MRERVTIMAEPRMPPELEQEVTAELDRSLKALVPIIARWPNFRRQIAMEFLGAAVGTADLTRETGAIREKLGLPARERT